MILSRRQVHLYAFAILAILLPICFLAGLLQRPYYNMVDNSADPLFQRVSSATEQAYTLGPQRATPMLTIPPRIRLLGNLPDRAQQQFVLSQAAQQEQAGPLLIYHQDLQERMAAPPLGVEMTQLKR